MERTMKLYWKIWHLLRKAAQKLGVVRAEKFAILCHQRSGSNMFCSMLTQHPQVDFFGQLFKDDPDFQNKIKSLGIPLYQGKPFDDGIESRERFDHLEHHPKKREPRNIATFVNQFYKKWEERTFAKRLGVKFHGGTLYRDEIEAAFLRNDFKIIVLHRENLLAAAVSWYQARELDQWRRDKTEKVKKTEMEMDIDQLRWFMENTKSDLKLWRQLLAQNHREFLELTYEEITSDAFNFDKVWQFLDVKPIPDPRPKTKKLIKNYDHIINLSEIKEKLQSDENGYL